MTAASESDRRRQDVLTPLATKNILFMSRQVRLDVIEAFEKFQRSGKWLRAVLVTETGRPDQALLNLRLGSAGSLSGARVANIDAEPQRNTQSTASRS